MKTSAPKKAASKPEAPISAALTLYQRSYCKRGKPPDVYIAAFRLIQATFLQGQGQHPHKVLYPGCHRHLSASLIWSHVDYVDCDSKVADVYQDAACRQWVQQTADYCQEATTPPVVPHYSFICADVTTSPRALPRDSYDLLLSLSAGILSPACVPYLIPGKGLLVVNDSHSDARTAFLDERLVLVGTIVMQGDQQLEVVTTHLERYFRTTQSNEPITHAMVQESIRIGSVAKRSFQLVEERNVLVYIFRRKGHDDEGTTARSHKRSHSTAVSDSSKQRKRS